MQSVLLKPSGLFTFPSRLAAVPQGALILANNAVLDRDSIISSRRGYKIYSNAMGSVASNTAHQLFNYKELILRHWGTGAGQYLDYDNGTGVFTSFNVQLSANTHTSTTVDNITTTSGLSAGMYVSGSGVPVGATIASITNNTSIVLSAATTTSLTGTTLTFYYNISEVSQGTRIKSVEANGNFYFTTSNGIQKISSLTGSGLSTSPITQAGIPGALDVYGTLNATSGFLTANSTVAYRIVWGITDSNNNVILGAPSERIVVNNPTGSSATVNLNFTIPQGITSNHFYQVYRTPVTNLVNTFTIAGDITGGSVNVINIADTSVLIAGATITGSNIPANTTISSISSATSIVLSQAANGMTVTGSTNGTTTVTLTSTAGLSPGMGITGTNIPVNTTITSITDGTHIVISNSASGSGSGITFTFTGGITAGETLTITQTLTGSQADPGDEEQLAYESNPVNADLTNGYIAITDITPDEFLGAYLYTNANSGLGITQANSQPPMALDVVSFKNYTFYANTSTKQKLNLDLLSISAFTPSSSSITITQTYTFNNQTLNCTTSNNSTSVTGFSSTTTLRAGQSISGANIQANTYIVSIASTSIVISKAATGSGATTIVAGYESSASKYVMISQFTDPGAQVEETARSLERVINRQANEVVYCYYLSGVNDVPGLMLLQARNLSQGTFTVTCNDAGSTGKEFSPTLSSSPTTQTTSSNESSPNRLYYSRVQQPDAVPLLNYIDIGPKDKSILRVLALRDNLYILKQEGIYRLTGLVAPFQVYPFDFSTILLAPDSAVVLNNQIYMFSNQGVATVSDSGVGVISRPIEDELIKLIAAQYTNFSTATFGVSYESDRAYYLFTVSATTDTFATQCFRWNTFTQTWTVFNISKRSGIVNDGLDVLFLSPTDTNYIEIERKNFDRTDLADREYIQTLNVNAVNGVNVTLPTLANVNQYDVILQTQYLTINQFNRLLTKLDNDPILTHNYTTTYSTDAGDDLNVSLNALVAGIAADSKRSGVSNAINASLQTVTITNASPAVFTNGSNTTGYYNKMPVMFTTTGTLPTGLSPNVIYYVSSLGVDGASKFRVSATAGGAEINTSGAGSGTHTTNPAYNALIDGGISGFAALQSTFNLLINILNNDVGVGYHNYLPSTSTVQYEFYIVSVNTQTNTITAPYAYNLIAGPLTIYSHIPVKIQFIPQTLGDVSLSKHVSEGTFIFEDAAFTTASVAYSSDLSVNFDSITINGTGNGIFGNTPFGDGIFGGNGSAIPFRTYIPRNKQRARYINAQFSHNVAREQFYLYGLSLTFNPASQSQRAWR